MVKPAQPFGRRGRLATASPPAHTRTPAIDTATASLPADLVASIVRPTAAAAGAVEASRQIRVARSFRAALLAGLCVGFFNAALNVTQVAAVGKELAPLLDASALPLPAVSLFIGLWSAARTTALSLLVTHRILDRLGWTRPVAYALGGAAVAVAYAAIVHALAPGLADRNLGVNFISGLGAGFFYRLFAGTQSSDPANDRS